MKVCNLLLLCLFNLFFSARLFAQNLFTEKTNMRYDAKFCMDCGTTKATCPPFTLNYITDKINRRYNFGNGGGAISFQVLVDSSGFSCVISHSDVTHSVLTSDLIRLLNVCIWKPATENGKPVSASVNVLFKVANGKISAKMERMDLSELASPGDPTIYNKQYSYTNSSLKNYDMTVWTKYNSPLPDNIGLACVVDKSDLLWYATARGLTRFDGTTFNAVNEFNSPLTATTMISDITVDKDNNKWMYANKAIYMYSDAGWKLFDSTRVAISAGYRIITNPTGEIFFTSHKGLMILRNEKVVLLDKERIPQLPSNDVYYAYYDTKGRLWIGTSHGSIVMDKKQNVTVFNGSDTPLNNVCITGITEDEHGNLYFSLNANKKSANEDIDEEGIAVMSADGKWTHYN